jgi:hypothetical protein
MGKPINIIVNIPELFRLEDNVINNLTISDDELDQKVIEAMLEAMRKVEANFNNAAGKNAGAKTIGKVGGKPHLKKNNNTEPPIAVFTTYLYSRIPKYDIKYLQNAAKQAELLDRLNGVKNTRVIAVSLDQLKNDKSLNLNPETDLIYEIRNVPDGYMGESDGTAEAGQTDMGHTAEDFQGKHFVGGFVWADEVPGGYNLPVLSATDLGNELGHERIAHGFKAMVNSLFSSGTDPDIRLRDSKLRSVFGDDYRRYNYIGIEKPVGHLSEYMGNAKYTTLRDREKYSNQSKLTIEDLTNYIMAKPGINKLMQEDEERQQKDIDNGEYKLLPEWRPVDYKNLDYLSNPDYTNFLNEYFKNIDFDNPYK